MDIPSARSRLRRGFRFGILALILGGAAPRASVAQASTAARPRLVVVITVDQLRGDLLGRYASAFTDGLKRLRTEGFTYSNARTAHGVTVSHPGHVTIATGTHPNRHGIVDGAWFERKASAWRVVDPTLDSSETILGHADRVGASPRQILRTTLTNWAMSADTGARFVAIGLGNISSVLHAGTQRGDVYWFSPIDRAFVTSTYYRTAYPEWVQRFNVERLPGYFRDSVWNVTVPRGMRRLALRDSQPAEGDGTHTTFPHRFASESEGRESVAFSRWVLGNTPFLDDATIALAEAAVRARGLGQRRQTDVLSIVLSATDEIGHFYGPRSLEQLDNLLRLDLSIGRLLRVLDTLVGKNRYVLALTADHGVADVPGTIGSDAFGPVALNQVAGLVSQVRLAYATATDSASAERAALRAARASPLVARAWSIAELGSAARTDSFAMLMSRSVRPDRRPRLPVFDPGAADGLAKYGVLAMFQFGRMLPFDPGVHGNPYDYDRRVALTFFGMGIPKGESDADAFTVDIAPTLAAVGGIRAPRDLDGRVLTFQPRRK